MNEDRTHLFLLEARVPPDGLAEEAVECCYGLDARKAPATYYEGQELLPCRGVRFIASAFEQRDRAMMRLDRVGSRRHRDGVSLQPLDPTEICHRAKRYDQMIRL